MMQKFSNNAATVTITSVSDSSTSITVSDGSVFPSLASGEYFLATLIGLDENGNEYAWEIVQVTARVADVLTVVRGQEGTVSRSWLAPTRIECRLTAGTVSDLSSRVSGLGVLGGPRVLEAGGVGVIPADMVPVGFVPMPGCDMPGHANWGNYQYLDGSVMVCIAATYYRVNHVDNPLHASFAPDDIDIKFADTFASRAAAAIAGYALHRAFIDGGQEKPWLLVDKYKCSKQAKGDGFVASSIKSGAPLSTSPDHNPIAEVTAAGANNYAACIDAAQGRDGENGAKNASSQFFCISVFVRSLLAMLSLAHGQRATSAAQAAWYDGARVKNFPKGCNNNALRDIVDASVIYLSDGYSNCGKTGSGTPFEKTTHNGQACGVTDLNGLLWEVSIGMTCIATTKSITGATQSSPCVLTVPTHGLNTGQTIQVTSVVGMTELNNKFYTVTVIDPDTISLDGVDSMSFTAYASGGSASTGSFYVAKESTKMSEFTSGATLATDHWGATGVAAMMEEIALPLAAEPGGSGMTRYVGSGALSSDTSGLGYILTGIGHPKDAASLAASGADLFGRDYVYQYIRDQMCVISGGYWSLGSGAGVFARALVYTRVSSNSSVGLRCACYPE
jgi:hypothetical protein